MFRCGYFCSAAKVLLLRFGSIKFYDGVSMLQSGLKFGLAAGLALWVSGASAATLTGAYSETYHSTSAGGTKIGVQNFNNGQFSFDLNPGATQTIGLFNISIDEWIDRPEDRQSNPISVTFNFTSPSGASGQGSDPMTVSGSTKGEYILFGALGDLVVKWGNSLDLTFGNGQNLKVTLSDLIIPQILGFDLPHTVLGTFILTGGTGSDPVATTPIPAALPLFVSGIAGLGMVSWRRKRKATLAAN